ncbi:MAG: hypothetical protein KDA89_10815 [Planctomycetaceae bacterium]|nr:hypothetical protein [Planctomycetaceae bacterium]
MTQQSLTEILTGVCRKLVDQQRARIIVPAQQPESGFWFGGGNMISGKDGSLYLVGRYRNAGDSRTGVAAGTRGLELAVFRSKDMGQTFTKILSWDKAALNSPAGDVLSIEGSCLRRTSAGVELFVSTEKVGIDYPEPVRDFLKPGAGVWTIDVLRADTVKNLQTASVEPLFRSEDPRYLHVKDPFLWPTAAGDRLGFCSHPFNWSSSNTGVADLPPAGKPITQADYNVFPRGSTWDVAMTRGTSILPISVPGLPPERRISVLFYCGGECVRPLEEHATAVRRPRGYSCEEIGGAAFYAGEDIAGAERLSSLFPLFVSPHGTGCSRYVDVLSTPDAFYVTWQQSQPDLSQPLVMNAVPRDEIERLIEGVGA